MRPKNENFPFTKQYVFYHNDMDGKAAAYLIHQRIILNQLGWNDTPSRYQRYDHNGDGFSTNYIDKATVTYVVDISFTDTTFDMLKEICEKSGFVIWIDHHASSVEFIEKHADFMRNANIFHYISSDACGALLTYAFSNIDQTMLYDLAGHGNDLLNFDFKYGAAADESTFRCSSNIKCLCGAIDKGIPKWLNLLDDYDRMKRRYIPETLRFIFGCDINNTGLSCSFGKGNSKKVDFNPFWSNLTTNPRTCGSYINDGRLIETYLNSRYTRESHVGLFEHTLPDGTICACINSRGNSINFQEAFNRYDACILFNMAANGHWVYSVYSNDNSSFNCAKFCEEHGGGGHFHAAGFTSDELLFNKD